MLRFLLLSCLSLLALSAQAQVQILTSIKPLQLIAAAIQDGQGEPQVLLPPGASPHYFVLRPSDAKRLDNADLYLSNAANRVSLRKIYPICICSTLPKLTLMTTTTAMP